MSELDPDATVNVRLHEPWLLYGETTQGFMTVSNVLAREITIALKRRSITRLRLGIWLWVLLFVVSCSDLNRYVPRKQDSLRLNENLDANALRILIGAGLGNRFLQLYKQWQQESANISSNARDTKASTEARIKMALEKESPLLVRTIHRTLVDAIIGVFP
jgi:hypothetical protein